MRQPDNIAALCQLPIDMLGLIFYPPSPRYAGGLAASSLQQAAPARIRRVGVFVDEPEGSILGRVGEYGLHAVQLHGAEPPSLCRRLSAQGVEVIKAFGVAEEKDMEACLPYVGACSYFLFDTKTPQHGGSGQRFGWQLLSRYAAPTPFFLSGGLDEAGAEAALQLRIPQLYALDLNSGFELAPGLKDVGRLERLMERFF
jgi:phosphoribosylanthranilate isomerase